MTLDDVGPVVTTERYHNNGRLIVLEVKCIKVSLDIQNSLGIIMCKFHAFQSKTKGMAASVRVFLEHPSYATHSTDLKNYYIYCLIPHIILYFIPKKLCVEFMTRYQFVLK